MQLQNFLAPAWAQQVGAAIAAADAAAKAGRGQVPAYDAGICGGWQAVGPCHKQRYLRYAPAAANGGEGEGAAEASAVGSVLAQIRDELFSTAAFARLLTKVGGRVGCVRVEECLREVVGWPTCPGGLQGWAHRGWRCATATSLLWGPSRRAPAVHNHWAGGAAERGAALPPRPRLHSGALRHSDQGPAAGRG